MLEFDVQSHDDEERAAARPVRTPFAHLALIGNALPRRCGLASFTSHVADALRQRFPALKVDHYAMDDGSGITYPPDVATIAANDKPAYLQAAPRSRPAAPKPSGPSTNVAVSEARPDRTYWS